MKETVTNRKKKIVISAANLFSGGTFTILKECLHYLEHDEELLKQYDITALVYKAELLPSYQNIKIQTYSKARSNWFYKLYYEYFFFKQLSEKWGVYLWFSLNDMSPAVFAERRAVYCHNPSPFYTTSLLEKKLDKHFWLFTVFYKYLYGINIRKNNYVIVQQNWIRQRFVNMFQLPPNRIIVAHPNIGQKTVPEPAVHKKGFLFLYPALPRVFKNFEVIVAATLLLQKKINSPFEVVFTISGTENKYAKYISRLIGNVPHIRLIGMQTSEQMSHLYQNASCLIFPSKLETWGLPITEAKMYGLPLLVADLPYAKETVGAYDKVSFFNPADSQQLSDMMLEFMENRLLQAGNELNVPAEPFTESWKETFRLLL